MSWGTPLQAEWRQRQMPIQEQQFRAKAPQSAQQTERFGTELAGFAFLFLLFTLLVGFAGLGNPYLGLSLAAAFGLFWLTLGLVHYTEEASFPAIPMVIFLLSSLLAVLVLLRPWYAIVGLGGFFLLLLFTGLLLQ